MTRWLWLAAWIVAGCSSGLGTVDWESEVLDGTVDAEAVDPLPGDEEVTDALDTAADVDEGPRETEEPDMLVMRPDLVPGDVTPGTSEIPAGQSLALTYGVSNDGTHAAGPFRVAFFLSEDNLVDPAVDARLCTVDLLGLEAAEAATYLTSCVVPLGAQPGAYYVGMRVDPDGLLGEVLESNNDGVGASTVTVKAPEFADLVGELTATTSGHRPGDVLDVHLEVDNLGTVGAQPFDVDLYLGPDPTLGPSATLVCTVTVAGLVPSQSKGFDLPYDCLVPAFAPGAYHVLAMVDPADSIPESDEANNFVAVDGIEILAPMEYDLTVEPDAGSYWLHEGDVNRFSARVRNLGNADVMGTVHLDLYFSTDSSISNADLWLCATSSVGPFPAGGSVALTVDCEVPSVVAGDYWFGAIVDSLGTLSEVDESNNAVADPLPVHLEPNTYDLVVTAVDGWDFDHAVQGQSVDVYANVENRGDTAVTDFAWRVVLSKDPVVDGTDVKVCAGTEQTDLMPGETRELTLRCDVPANVHWQFWYVGVELDEPGDWVEVDETNNAAVDPFQVYIDQPDVDLQVTYVWQNYSVASILFGDDPTFIVDVYNAGSDPVDETAVDIWYSTDSAIEPLWDTWSCRKTVLDLGAWEKRRLQFTCPIPVFAIGVYWAGASVDADDDVLETNEDNNNRAQSSSHQLFL